MTVDQAIAKAFLHAQRKATPPAAGTSKYNVLLGLADSFQKLWAAEEDTDWDSLYSLVTLAVPVSVSDTFALTNTIDYISQREDDFIYLDDGNNRVPVTFVSPSQLYEYKDVIAAARIGSNLKFSKAFLADSSSIGSSIKVPAFLYPNEITSGSDVIQVPRPMWLAYMMAAEFVRNDPVKQGQYDNILALAEMEMGKMKKANGGQMDTVGTPGGLVMGESW